MKEGAYLYLRIVGSDLDFEQISNKTGLIPCFKYKKGEILKSEHFENVCTEDCWSTDYEIPEGQTLNEAIVGFVRPYILQNDFISELSEKNRIELWLSIYPANRQMSFMFSREVLSMVSSLNVELGIAITNLTDFYEGTYESFKK